MEENKQEKEQSSLELLRGKISDKIVDEGIGHALETTKKTFIKKNSSTVLQTVVPIVGSGVVGSAAVGFGLMNMGLGIYNLYQGHQLQGQVEQLDSVFRDQFSSMHKVLHDQARVLEILNAKQDAILEGLELLRQEMKQGFDGVQETLQNQEAQRKKEQFEEKTYRVLRAYKDFVDMDFVLDEAEVLRARADELEGWLIGQMKTISPRDPIYFPWLVALVFARRARIDVFRVKGERYQKKANMELAQLLADVKKAFLEFIRDRTVYELTVSLHEIVEGYANLWQGLEQGREFSEMLIGATKSELLLPEVGLWDDGFDIFREMLQEEDSRERIPATQAKQLKTISDYQWFCTYQEQDETNFDVHSCTEVSVGEMLGKMGHPDPMKASIKQGRLEVLSELVLPEYRELLEKGIREKLEAPRFQIALPISDEEAEDSAFSFFGLLKK